MEQIRSFFAGLDYTVVYTIAASVIAIMLHELSHGLAAKLMGDPTADRMGRLSLNPLRHIDLMGLLMMVFFRFGWAKPVPVNMDRFKRPKLGMAVTALAGPVSNLILAFFALLLRGLVLVLIYRFNVGGIMWMLDFLAVFASLSIGLGIFNLIPIPPLDGSKVLFSLLPEYIYRTILRYERWCMIALMAVLYFGWLTKPLTAVLSGLLDFMWNTVIRIVLPLL